jgi:uncharacterized protein YjbI with pentapeptide repeats
MIPKRDLDAHAAWVTGWPPDGAQLTLDGRDLRQESFHGTFLEKAVFRDCDLAGVSFAYADLDDASFIDCHLDATALIHLRNRGLRLMGCRGRVLLVESTVSTGRLDRCLLAQSGFRAAWWTGVEVTDCDLRDSLWTDAVLRDVRFVRCDLRGTGIGPATPGVECLECQVDDG